MAQQQKILLYIFPVVFAVTGVYFPVGVLLYWLTTNLWTMGQQFYVIRKMPAPGSKAEEALMARKAAKGKGPTPHGSTAVTDTTSTDASPPVRRQQPKKQTRNQRRVTPPKTSPAPKAPPAAKAPPPGKAAPAAKTPQASKATPPSRGGSTRKPNEPR